MTKVKVFDLLLDLLTLVLVYGIIFTILVTTIIWYPRWFVSGMLVAVASTPFMYCVALSSEERVRPLFGVGMVLMILVVILTGACVAPSLLVSSCLFFGFVVPGCMCGVESGYLLLSPPPPVATKTVGYRELAQVVIDPWPIRFRRNLYGRWPGLFKNGVQTDRVG